MRSINEELWHQYLYTKKSGIKLKIFWITYRTSNSQNGLRFIFPKRRMFQITVFFCIIVWFGLGPSGHKTVVIAPSLPRPSCINAYDMNKVLSQLPSKMQPFGLK